jgi:hypothetical protein
LIWIGPGSPGFTVKNISISSFSSLNCNLLHLIDVIKIYFKYVN